MGMISVYDTQTPLKDFGAKVMHFYEMRNKFMKELIMAIHLLSKAYAYRGGHARNNRYTTG
jgi:hypothetical protein